LTGGNYDDHTISDYRNYRAADSFGSLSWYLEALMKRSKDWAVVELRKGLAGDKCSMCLTDLSRQAMIFKSTNPQGKKVRLEYRCWRCVRSAEGAYLFVTEFPGVFETYRNSHGAHLLPSRRMHLLLGYSCENSSYTENPVDECIKSWKGKR